MIIQVKSHNRPFSEMRYTYNADPSIRKGDLVELPQTVSTGTWLGEVTAVASKAAALLTASGYRGPIKAIVGRAPLKVTVEANTHSALRQKLLDALEDLDDNVFYHADGSER